MSTSGSTLKSTLESSEIICTMCGTRFDPAEHRACQACPLQKGCQVVCCPACGFETVDVEQSRLARAFRTIFLGSRFFSPQRTPRSQSIIFGTGEQSDGNL